MSLSRLHTVVSVAWLSLAIALLVVRLAAGSQPLSIGELALWLTLGVPVFLVRRVFRGAPLTMAQLIRDTEQGDGQRSAASVSRESSK